MSKKRNNIILVVYFIVFGTIVKWNNTTKTRIIPLDK